MPKLRDACNLPTATFVSPGRSMSVKFTTARGKKKFTKCVMLQPKGVLQDKSTSRTFAETLIKQMKDHDSTDGMIIVGKIIR